MELVRQILLEISEGRFQLEHSQYDDSEGLEANHLIAYHLDIMTQAGLITSETKLDYSNNYMLTKQPVLTWEGNDFLDSIKNEKIWSKIKNKISKEGGDIPFAVLKTLAIKYSEQLFLSIL